MNLDLNQESKDLIDNFYRKTCSGDLKRDLNCIKFLKNLDVQDEKGWTALMMAAYTGELNVVQELVNIGCNLSITNIAGQTAKDIADFHLHRDVAELLICNKNKFINKMQNNINVNRIDSSIRQNYSNIAINEDENKSIERFNYPILLSNETQNFYYEHLATLELNKGIKNETQNDINIKNNLYINNPNSKFSSYPKKCKNEDSLHKRFFHYESSSHSSTKTYQSSCNYFSGNPLDRFHNNRKDQKWLDEVMHDPKSIFILFSDLLPLVISSSATTQKNEFCLARFSYIEAKKYFGPNQNIIFLGVEINPQLNNNVIGWKRPLKENSSNESINKSIDENNLIATNKNKSILENITTIDGNIISIEGNNYNTKSHEQIINSKNESDEQKMKRIEVGWFAIEMDESIFSDFESDFNTTIKRLPFPAGFINLAKCEAAIASQAKSLLTWHMRNKFCPTCGSKSFLCEGGYKRQCSNDKCKSNHGIHNSCYPRVDPTVIMAVISPDEQRILLARNKNRHSTTMWSILAGFMEPGESIEEACRREVFEETMITVNEVKYHSSQPWPGPSTLMIGLICKAIDMNIQVDLTELSEAKWFDRDEVKQMLNKRHPLGFILPPKQAIAYCLIKHWLY